MLVQEFLQNLLARGILSGLGFLGLLVDFQFLEKDFAQLFRRSYIKRCVRQSIDFFLDFLDFAAKILADLLQVLRVDFHTVGLHTAQHGHKRHLDVVKQFFHSVFLEQRQQFFIELQGDVSVLGGVFLCQLYWHFAHGFLLSALANQVFDGDGDVVEIDFGQIVHVVALFGLQKVMR